MNKLSRIYCEFLKIFKMFPRLFFFFLHVNIIILQFGIEIHSIVIIYRKITYNQETKECYHRNHLCLLLYFFKAYRFPVFIGWRVLLDFCQEPKLLNWMGSWVEHLGILPIIAHKAIYTTAFSSYRSPSSNISLLCFSKIDHIFLDDCDRIKFIEIMHTVSSLFSIGTWYTCMV